MKRVLFVCSRNKLRSPTAEQVFCKWPGVEVASAGTDPAADNPVTPELLQWAELIFVMERVHKTRLMRKFRAAMKHQRVVCLDIPDDYEFMDPQLIQLLNSKVVKFLPVAP